MDLSFSGAGFMGCYYFGVVNCWNKYIPRERVRRVAGASAGSLIAAYYLMDLPLDACLKEIIELTEDVRRRPLGVFDRSNQIVDVLPRALDKMFPDDAHKRVNGRLYVCMTRLRDMKNVTVNEFETKQDLIDALNCSCFIPVWSGNHVSTYKGVKHIDGGFTNNLPVFDEHTIRICCFSGASDIAPNDRSQADFMSGSVQGMPFNLNWKNMRRGRRALWPPPPSYIIELLERGFHDAKDFILSNDLIQCNKCYKSAELEYQQIYSKIAPTISPSVSRSGSFRKDHNGNRESPAANPLESSGSSSSAGADKFSSSFSSSLDNYGDQGPVKAVSGRNKLAAVGRRRASSANVNDSSQRPATSAILERRRSKSGKQITLESLELASQIKQEAQALASASNKNINNNNNNNNSSANKSLVGKLREKLTRKASKSSLESGSDKPEGKQQHGQDGKVERLNDIMDEEDDNGYDDNNVNGLLSGQSESPPVMPSIVIDQALLEAKREANSADTTSESQIPALLVLDTSDDLAEVGPVSGRDSGHLDDRDSPVQVNESRQQQQQDSASSIESESLSLDSNGHVSSDDSAVELGGGTRKPPPPTTATVRTKTRPGGRHSPGDIFIASRRQSLAMAHQLSAEFERQQQQGNSLMPDRFSFAPSPLPSCPPSPNLNRHCTECIRMRQEARLDGIDESIRREAEKYGSLDDKEPEKEFNTLKYKISNWFRQFGGAKYYYSFDDDDAAAIGDGSQAAPNRGHKSPQVSPRRRASEIPYLS